MITVIESRDSDMVPDGGFTSAAEDVVTFFIRKSEICEPKRGDILKVGVEKYTVKRAEPDDSLELEWLVHVRAD